MRRKHVVPAILLAGGVLLGSVAAASAGTHQANAVKKVALLLPEVKTTRYEAQDRPLFTAKLKALCPTCALLYSNASQDPAKQQSQAEAAINNGANVMVLDPVDSKAAAAIVRLANQKKIPVISYDRLILGVPLAAYISYDNKQVGVLQATALVNRLKKLGKKSGNIVQINGDPTDNNAGLFKQGATSVLSKSPFKVTYNVDTPGWSSDKAQAEMDGAIAKLGKNGFVGVYAANDGTAGGTIASMKGAGIKPLPPVTGQDAELAGVQRILLGEQYMTVFKAYKPEAEAAAAMAAALANGKSVPSSLINKKIANGAGNVPSLILTPVAVTKDNVKSAIIKSGLWKAKQVCTGPVKAVCVKLGIK